MKLSDFQFSKVWGWNPTGDFGPFTFYTSHKRQVVVGYMKAPPDKPPSWKQKLCRTRFKNLGILWHQLGGDRRRAWTLAAERANLRISGFNLWTHCQITGNWSTALTVQRQSKVNLGL